MTGTTFGPENADEYVRGHAAGRGSKWRRFLSDVAILGRLARAVARGDYHLATPQIALMLSGLGYVVSPVDAVPDVIPVVGLGDDAVVVALVVGALSYEIVCFRDWEQSQRGEARH